MIVARLVIALRMRIPSPTPRAPMRPRRNGFWIFMVPPGSVAVGSHAFGLLKDAAQVLEVPGHSLALNPNQGEALFRVRHEALCALLRLLEQSRGPLLGVVDDLSGGLFGLLPRLGDRATGLRLERLGFGTGLGGALDGVRQLHVGLVEVLLRLGDSLLVSREVLLLGLVAARLQLDVQVDAGLRDLARARIQFLQSGGAQLR